MQARRSKWITGIVGALLTTLGASLMLPARGETAAFYVSPSGSDSNDGRSVQSPFQSLEKAQSAMRASSVKTTYLLGGTYTRSAPLKLYKEDNGESWLGYAGQTPVLDGGESTPMGITVTGDRITIRWITLQNFVKIGINVWNSSNVLVDSNTILNTLCTGWNQGGISLSKNINNVRVTHNLVKGSQYAGIMYVNSSGDRYSSLDISFNEVLDTCTKVKDCGALYADDEDHQGTGLVLRNNIVGNFGDDSKESKGIYLDAYISNAVVEDNIVYGSGSYGMQIHGGSNDVFRNNIFDISGVKTLGLYQLHPTPRAPAGGMNGNAFTCNIVYSSKTPPPALWSVKLGSNDNTPRVEKNLYWGSVRALPNGGPVADASPTVADPHFESPAEGKYSMPADAPSFCDFHAIERSRVGPVANS
jgi:hypothetical protein